MTPKLPKAFHSYMLTAIILLGVAIFLGFQGASLWAIFSLVAVSIFFLIQGIRIHSKTFNW